MDVRRPYRANDDAFLLLSAGMLMLAAISAVGGLLAYAGGGVPVGFAVAPPVIFCVLAGVCSLMDFRRGGRRR